MFLFSKPLYAYRLYAFSRRLAEFQSQHVLKKLPLRFLTQRQPRRILSGLPEDPDERLSRFLACSGVPEQTLALYLALYPDISGEELSERLFRSIRLLPDFPEHTEAHDQKRAVDLLKLFHTLCLHANKSKKWAESFERFLNNELDFRLEASLLERINDLFYEDESIRTALPDWFATTKDRLTLQKNTALRSLRDSPDKEKTAATLTRALIRTAFRDGTLIIPFAAGCRTDEQGRLFFTRLRFSFFLTKQEKRFAFSFTEALSVRDFSKAAQILSTSGMTSESIPVLTRRLERTGNNSALSLSQKAETFLKETPDLPLFFRYGTLALKATENLCQKELEIGGNIWKSATADISEFQPEEKTSPLANDMAKSFQHAFSLLPHHQERLAIQSREAPAFLNNQNKITELLSRQTVFTQLQPTRNHTGLIFIIAAVICSVIIFLLT